ncbi:MAG: hypothetical protein ARM1_0593 [Candidatus Micrarchaeota archaeon]|nr:MAG: hypothetical protein ARM1_0593 [Candidatus Micrarchaeota archaeon]
MYDIDAITLDNGLRCYLVNNGSDALELRAAFKAGKLYEDRDERQKFHTIEHMLLNKTRKMNSTELIRSFEKIGAYLNGKTGMEEMYIEINVHKDHIKDALDLLSEMIFNYRFTDKTLNAEKSIVINEILSDYSSLEGIIWMNYINTVLDNFDPSKEELIRGIKAFTLDDIKRSYEGILAKDSLYLLVVGNIDKDIKSYINGLFSKYELRDHSNIRIIDKIDKKIKQIDIDIGPSFEEYALYYNFLVNEQDLKDRAANMILRDILNYILFYNLRVKKGITYTPSCEYERNSLLSLIELQIQVLPKNFNRAKKALENIIDNLSRYIDNEIFEVYKNGLINRMKRDMTDSSYLADIFIDNYRYVEDNKITDLDMIDIIKDIELSDIKNIVENYIYTDKAGKLFLLNSSKNLKQ